MLNVYVYCELSTKFSVYFCGISIKQAVENVVYFIDAYGLSWNVVAVDGNRWHTLQKRVNTHLLHNTSHNRIK